jgi:hypothetical protein
MNKLAWTLVATMGISLCATVIEPGKLPENFDPNKVEIRKLVESTPRGGLPNFYAKLDSKQDTVIAYFGGSITAQAGYRVHSLKYFQEEYKETKVAEINAAIGGTGSDLGAYRLEHDVLKFKPDLVFVEFAVNDGGASPYSIRQSMEGIVRHIWNELPSCDIIFVYTLTAGNVKELQDGKMQRSASVMEEIADYYQIPSIHMGVEIVALEKQGKLLMKASNEGMTRVSARNSTSPPTTMSMPKARSPSRTTASTHTTIPVTRSTWTPSSARSQRSRAQESLVPRRTSPSQWFPIALKMSSPFHSETQPSSSRDHAKSSQKTIRSPGISLTERTNSTSSNQAQKLPLSIRDCGQPSTTSSDHKGESSKSSTMEKSAGKQECSTPTAPITDLQQSDCRMPKTKSTKSQ